MEKLPMCRVCLAQNVRMYVVVNQNLHTLYEKLTDNPFVTEDRRPMLACFFCCTKLKQYYQFQRKCLEAEEMFAQMINEDYEAKPFRYRDPFECFNGFIQSPVVHLSIVDACQTAAAVKEEPAVYERFDVIIEPKEEHHSDLELEHADQGYSNIEDTSTQRYSESDSEDDVPLIECKIEVVEEQEEVNKKRRASDTQRAAVAKNPQLHIQRTELEDVITEEQTKSEQSDVKVTQNSQNCTSKTVTKNKEHLPSNSRVNNTNETRIPAGENPFKCDVCQRYFSQKTHLTNHIRNHTGEKPFKCDICQRCFSVKGSLTRHIRIHSGEKPFKCDVCQRCFSQKVHLTNHIRNHAGEKPFKCDFCQRCFSMKSTLTHHIRLHTGEKPFKCNICQRSFMKKMALTRHIRTHTGEKPFKCDICQRCFCEKRSLTNHIRLHTGDKPFKCDLCQRSFRQKIFLTSHIRTHTGEKPFKCGICQRCFSEKSNLTKHVRTHTGEKPLECDTCQLSSKSKSD